MTDTSPDTTTDAATDLAVPTPNRLRLPAGACDTHCHVFGPPLLFPYARDRTFTPPAIPVEELLAFHDRFGFDRAVMVQSSAHGYDHRVLLHALSMAQDRYRGVALVHSGTGTTELDQLHAAGVRGARLHFLPHLGEAPDLDEIDRVVRMIADRGWHLELHLSGTAVAELADAVAALPVPVVIDHMARFDLAEGLAGPSVSALRRLLDTGHVWVKVSGIDRLSQTGPPYDDAVALARLLVRHAPERTLWGSDHPHVNITGPMPDDGLLVELLAQIAPQPEHLERLLVINPAEVFDFPAATAVATDRLDLRRSDPASAHRRTTT